MSRRPVRTKSRYRPHVTRRCKTFLAFYWRYFSVIPIMYWIAFTLLGSFTSLDIVSADKSNIVVNTASVSWISMENLTTLLEVSYSVSKCCNVYLSASKSAATENIFNAFAKIYPYAYTINNRTYDCNSYFMISESIENLVTDIRNVPTTIATTEILIIVDDSVNNSAKLFDVSMYDNANVNIAARNGLWALSDHSLRLRAFKKLFRYKEMARKRGILNFEGRELHAAALYDPPFCYLQTIVNRTVNGIEAQFYVAENESQLDGVELKLFMLIAERLNTTWTVRYHSDEYGTWNETDWDGGFFGLLLIKEVDIAFDCIFLEEYGYRFVNLTTPWSLFDVRFLVPRPKPRSSFWALTRPLSSPVWVAVFAMIIVQSIYVYTRAWISPRIPNRFQSFAITWTEMMGRLLGTCAPENMQGLEIQLQLWHFVGIVVVIAYSSNLAADLTNSRYEDRIDTARDFVKANVTWGSKIEPNFALYFNEYDQYSKQLRKQFETEKNEADRHNRILQGNYAIIGSTIGSTFLPMETVLPEDLKDLRVMKEHLSDYYTSFAVQPWLLESVDKVILWLKEGGLVEYHMQDVLHRRVGSEFREVAIEHDGYLENPMVLDLTPLAAGFFMLIVGLCISTIVFYIELHSVSRKSSIRQVLINIKRKHDLRRVMELKKKIWLSK